MSIAAPALLALTAANTINSAITQKRQGDYEGQVADTNAALARQQGADAIARGNEAANRSQLGTRQLIGAQRSAIAANGVDVGSGTAADLQSDAAGIGALDALALKNNAAREAFGYSVDAMNQTSRGQMARAAGRNAMRSTLLTGAARAYDIGRSSYGGRSRGGGAVPSSDNPDWAD